MNKPTFTKFLFSIFLLLKVTLTMSQQKNIIIKGGTTVIAVIQKDEVIIAADSKHVLKNHTNGKNFDTHVCKINVVDDVCFAFAGSVDISFNGKEIFNCKDIMTETLSKKLPFDTTISSFNLSLEIELRKVNSLIGKIPLPSNEELAFISIIIVKYIDDIPVFRCLNYYLSYENDNLKFKIKDETSSFIPIMHKIGSSLNIDNFLKSNPVFLESLDNIQKKIEYLIGIEASQNPKEVGLPIDMIKMTKDGCSWLIKNN